MDIGKGWDGQKAQWVGRLNRSDGKITVGVCAREKKARSKHMEAITSRLNRDKFEVCVVCGYSLCVHALSTYSVFQLPKAVGSQCWVGSKGAQRQGVQVYRSDFVGEGRQQRRGAPELLCGHQS